MSGVTTQSIAQYFVSSSMLVSNYVWRPERFTMVLPHTFESAGTRRRAAFRLRTMAQLEHPGARFEEERRQHKEVVAAHELDVDVTSAAEEPLELACRRQTGEAATQHDDAHPGDPFGCSNFLRSGNHGAQILSA